MMQVVPVLVPIAIIGLMVLWLIVGVPRLQRRRIGDGPAGPVSGPNVAQREVLVPISEEAAHQRTLEAVSRIRARVVADEPRRVCASRSISPLSGGEVITAWLWADGDRTRVLVESRSMVKGQRGTLNRNHTNVAAIIDHVSTAPTAAR